MSFSNHIYIYITLSLLAHISGSKGLYRDDFLMALRGSPRQIELKKKEICRILQSTGTEITVEANQKVVNILDLTLNLNTGTYQTFNKPNNNPLYVHKQSNHPPSILKNIPLSVNKRLTSNSSNKEMFEQSSGPFQKALKDSGYNHTLEFEPVINQTKPGVRRKPRKIIWFVPPYSSNVTTRIGSKILSLVDSCFPPGHRLHTAFNRNNIKVSYRTTPNIKQIITGHNKKIQSKQNTSTPNPICKCSLEPCPVGGQCIQEGVIYQTTVTHTDPESKKEVIEKYVGMTANSFKVRYTSHKSSFKLKHKSAETELSKHVWYLKDRGIKYNVNWRILDRAKPFSPISRNCKLCTLERYYLLFKRDLHTLNSDPEFAHDCTHKRFLKLSMIK